MASRLAATSLRRRLSEGSQRAPVFRSSGPGQARPWRTCSPWRAHNELAARQVRDPRNPKK